MVSIASTAANEQQPTPARWRPTLRLLGEVAREQPLPFIGLIVFVLIANARVGVYIAAQGGMVDAVLSDDMDRALFWAAAFLLTELVEEVYWTVKPWITAVISDRTVHRIQKRVMQRAASVPLVAFESGPFFAKLQRASDGLGQRFSMMLMSLVDSLQVFTMGASILVPLWLVSPWIAVVVMVAAIPATLLEFRLAGIVQESERRTASERHLVWRIVEIIRDRNAGAELRMFGNGPLLANGYFTTQTMIDDDQLEAEGKLVRNRGISEVIRQVAVASGVAIALWAITGKHMSVGSWVIAVNGIQWIASFTTWSSRVVLELRENVAYAGDLFDYEDLADDLIAAERRTRHAHTHEGVPPVSDGGVAISLEGVSFAYPGGDQPVVRDLTLDIPPGQTVAIVGENGAGKSTLVRLITGLYLPGSGTVRLDGVDTRCDAIMQVAPRVAAVFQDYLAFQLPVRENVAFGDVDRPVTDAAVDRALDKANLTSLVDTLDDGLDTWLGRQFGERDLSGGQWQRVALARAFYRDADLVILDEPTAALDPRAEQALFDRFAELMQDRTAIMISHRLGSARHADRILVMDDGQLVEDGTHEDLIAAGGLYAAMFAAQAAWYLSSQVLQPIETGVDPPA